MVSIPDNSSNSGKIYSSRPVDFNSLNPLDGQGLINILLISSVILSREIILILSD